MLPGAQRMQRSHTTTQGRDNHADDSLIPIHPARRRRAVSPIKPDCDFTLTYRLVAEEGMLLTKEGQEPTPCIDTDVTDGWSEIEEVAT